MTSTLSLHSQKRGRGIAPSSFRQVRGLNALRGSRLASRPGICVHLDSRVLFGALYIRNYFPHITRLSNRCSSAVE